MPSPLHTHTTMTRPQTPVQAPALRVKTQIEAGFKGGQKSGVGG